MTTNAKRILEIINASTAHPTAEETGRANSYRPESWSGFAETWQIPEHSAAGASGRPHPAAPGAGGCGPFYRVSPMMDLVA